METIKAPKGKQTLIKKRFTDLHKNTTTHKTHENKLIVQLHHFANLTKSTTITKVTGLNLTGEALLKNDYFQIINQSQEVPEFVARPFVINSSTGEDSSDALPNPTHHQHKTKRTQNNIKEYRDLVLKKIKERGKDRCPKNNPFAVACHDLNALINIKDYKRMYCKKIFETRLFINGVLIYDKLKDHYTDVNVSRNCLKKKFVSQLNKVTTEVFPEMEMYRTTNDRKEDRLLQNVMNYYENQENDMNVFNNEIVQPQQPRESQQLQESQQPQQPQQLEEEVMMECEQVESMEVDERPRTPENNVHFAPESYHTPPSQRLIPVDLSASTTSRYQTVFREKDPQSGVVSLFEVPESFQVTTNTFNTNVNKSVLKKINLTTAATDAIATTSSSSSTTISKPTKREKNDLELLAIKKLPKKRLFHNYVKENEDCDDDGNEGFRLLDENEQAEQVFVRPIYSPKEFTQYKRMRHRQYYTTSPPPTKNRKYLCVDEIDLTGDAAAAPSVPARIKTPEQHRYYPFVQFHRN